MNTERLFYKILRTKVGKICIIWKESKRKKKIIQIILPKFSLNSVKKNHSGILPGKNQAIDKIAKQINLHINGKRIQFSTDLLDLEQLGSFQRKVLRITRKIPWGKVESYGSIAEKVGVPRGARAAGQALANNPFPIIIPCHRVIRSDRTIGGFGDNIELKRKLLKIEGITIK
ncbi:MAG: methylated-DNA--[protein]-cysteine S-methyltransferase [candidate division WOR-3 bacterium]